jgi:hypothetical protein
MTKLKPVEDVQSQPDAIETASPPTANDPFDLSRLTLSQDFVQTAGVKRLVLTVPIRKPTPQEFIRVHPDPAYRAVLAVIELKDDREFYLLTPEIARDCLVNLSRCCCSPPSTGRA